MRASSGKRAGRSHRARNLPCQDAFAVHEAEGGGRIAAAVADGLGSRPLSHVGSEVASAAASKSLAHARHWGPGAVHRAFRAARKAVAVRARELGVPMDDLATTLQVAGVTPGHAIAGIVGDGAVLYSDGEARILLAPEDSEYANHVVPLTSPEWQDHLRVASTQGAARLFLLTDGLTRLLMTRRAREWQPYAPFFQAVLPRIEGARLDDGFVTRLLDNDRIDTAWDDDKCLVVMGLE